MKRNQGMFKIEGVGCELMWRFYIFYSFLIARIGGQLLIGWGVHSILNSESSIVATEPLATESLVAAEVATELLTTDSSVL